MPIYDKPYYSSIYDDNEPLYAPVGDYNLGIDKNGLVKVVPTYKASRTVTVAPSEEYINPEFIVSPTGVKPLVDDIGKPAYSVDAYNIVLKEKHKPLNPYQYYMESKGVAPKDVEAEHLIQRYRADLAAERANLSPFIANLLTGMYATAAQEGWNNIKNGKYFTGASEILSPLMFGEDAWNKVAQGLYGGIQLLNENGVPKTWKEIKEGNYGRAALSGAGDLFNLTLAGIGGNLIYKSTLDLLASKGNTWARAKLIANTLDNLTPTISSRSVAVENNGGSPIYSLYDEFGTPIGDLITTDAIRTKGGRSISWVSSKNKGHGITKDLYSTAAYDTENGLETGWNLMSPEKTMAATKSLNYLLVPRTYTEVRLINRLLNRSLPQLIKGNHYIEVGTKPNSDIVYNEVTGNFERIIPKLQRMFSEGTYPIYTGPKHSIYEVVNTDGTVNPRAAMQILHEVANYFKLFGKSAYKMEERLENPEWHTLDPNTYLHTKNVALTAYQLPTPPGFTKLDLMVAALGHDLGKIVAGEGHEEVGAALIKLIFPDATPELIKAVMEHMLSNPQSILGKYTKAADIINGRGLLYLRELEPELYNFVTEIRRSIDPKSGKIRLALPSHTTDKPREFTLEPIGDNKFRVHMRIWDDVKNQVPGNITNEERQQLFDALYNELPEGAEILLPESGPGNYATRGTIAGLMRLSRDPRFRPGSPGVLLYNDRGIIKTFNGTSFIKDSKASRLRDIRGIYGDIPIITEENAAFMTPEQWTAAQDAAIARGDMTEAQRLRDLHFKVKAPDTKIIDESGNPTHSYHGTGVRFNEFDTTGKYSTLDEGYYGKGAYFAPNKEIAQMYADTERTPIVYDTYLNIKNPLRHVRDENAELYGKTIVNNDGVISILPDDLVDGSFDMTEFVATKPNQIKSADAVTYDDKGVRIPLGERDNFNIGDIRYFYNQSQYPNVSIRGRVPIEEHNPLDVRIQRMMERARLKEENPEVYNMIYGEKSPFDLPQLSVSVLPRTTNYNIRRAMLDIDPSLSLQDLDTAAQIVMANKGGVHFNIYNNSGDVMGGVSMIDIQDAVNLVRKLNGREALPYDISMIAGHEYGHGLNLPKEVLESVKGYYAPEEFFTLAGQVLDDAGLIHTTTEPISFAKFISLLDKYLQKGNLDNGISKMKEYLLSLDPMQRQRVMKNINRFSVGVLGMFGVSLLAKNNSNLI